MQTLLLTNKNSDFNDSKQQRKTNEYNKQKLDITQNNQEYKW